MDEDKASRFISSLVKSIQALCNGFVDFSTSIEVIGHIHLNIDRNVKLDYVLTEEVSKSASEGSTVFASHSYHSQSPSSVASKNTNDTSNHGQKSRKDNETDPLGLSALPREVPNTSKSDSQSSNRIGDNRNSSHTSSGSVGFSRNSDSETLRHERSSFQVEDSTNKRRKIGPFSQSNPHPAAKRNRPNDFGSDSRTVVKESGFEVIEIKEEPDEDVPAVFFGGSSSGQDIQTPDFSNVVMESLDRVSQLEQNTDLAGEGGDGMGEYKQPVFPVMFHQGDGMSSSAGGRLPGPSSDPQAIASTSGEDLFSDCKLLPPTTGPSFSSPSTSSFSPRWGVNHSSFPSFAPTMMSPIQHPAFSAMSSLWLRGGVASYKPRPRLQYSADQITAAIQDVDMGKSISKAAKDHGVPFTSLYRKVKARSSSSSSQHNDDFQPPSSVVEESLGVPASVVVDSESLVLDHPLPALDALSEDIAFFNNEKSDLDDGEAPVVVVAAAAEDSETGEQAPE